MRIRVLLLLVSSLAIGGCSSSRDPYSSERLHAPVNVLAHDVDVDSWEHDSNNLLFLVRRGDPEAIAVAWKALPIVHRWAVHYDDADWLALSLYEQDDLRGMNSLSVEDQCEMFKYFGQLQPLDWSTVSLDYLRKHPAVAERVKMPNRPSTPTGP